jgi:hypothetical protein
MVRNTGRQLEHAVAPSQTKGLIKIIDKRQIVPPFYKQAPLQTGANVLCSRRYLKVCLD